MKHEKKLILFQPPDNKEIQTAVRSWLLDAGGRLSLKEIEKKFYENFHFFYPQIYTDEQLNSYLENWKEFVFRIEDGFVFID